MVLTSEQDKRQANKNRYAKKNRERIINHHHNKMTNTFSKINDEQIRIASETRSVSELQESKRCLETTTTNKKMKEVNSFAKGATYLCSKSRIASALHINK